MSLQQNEFAMRELSDLFETANARRNDAEAAAHTVSTAEMSVEQLEAKVLAAGRRLPAADSADSSLGAAYGDGLRASIEALNGQLADARQRLADAERRASTANAAYLSAHNGYVARRRQIYDAGPDPFAALEEVG